MNASMDYRRVGKLIFLLLSLILIVQFPGEFAQAAPPGAAASVSLQMNNPSCVQPQPASGVCSILVRGLTANGSTPDLSRVEVSLNGKLRVVMGGFFESTATLQDTMLPGGLKVLCGVSGQGGLPNYGAAYLIKASAFMADGSSASNSTNVYCPISEGNNTFFFGKVYLPEINK
jgi:hypothetical protein